MSTETRPLYVIDKDISLEMTKLGNSVYVSIYNDRRNTSIAFQTSMDNMKFLADFIYKNLENKNKSSDIDNSMVKRGATQTSWGVE
jgi:hypothetical protein